MAVLAAQRPRAVQAARDTEGHGSPPPPQIFLGISWFIAGILLSSGAEAGSWAKKDSEAVSRAEESSEAFSSTEENSEMGLCVGEDSGTSSRTEMGPGLGSGADSGAEDVSEIVLWA